MDCLTTLSPPVAATEDRGNVVFLLIIWNQTSIKRWVVCVSKESCGDGKMWVSVLGAAEHPVPALPGPQYPGLQWLPAH